MKRAVFCLLVVACGDEPEADDPTTPGTTSSLMGTTSAGSTAASTSTDPPATDEDSGSTTTTGLDPQTTSSSSSSGTPVSCNAVDESGPSFVRTVWPILMDRCQAPGQVCHQDGAAVLGLDLDMDAAYDSLVCVEAGEADLFRVDPGDPEGSYWLAKLEGRQVEVGGVGAQMPLGKTPLDEVELTTIREWISGGAAP